MEKRDVEHLERKINELQKGLASLGDDNPVTDLLRVIHNPGWTTPAELLFFTGMLDAMVSQARVLGELKATIASAASRVELNPQPLPA